MTDYIDRSLRLVADSASPAGDRITTLWLMADRSEALILHRLESTVATTADTPEWLAPTLVTTGDLSALCRHPGLTRFTDALTVAAGHTPREVDDEDLHVPYITDAERGYIDRSLQGVVSGARCHRFGHSRDIYTDVELYQQLLTGPTHRRHGLNHPALASSHVVFADKQLPPGRIPGWLTWEEMLIHRGETT